MEKIKVDVEGFNGDLLVAYSKWVVGENQTCYADFVFGEFNELSNGRIGGDEVNLALVQVGYVETANNGHGRVWKYAGKIFTDLEVSPSPSLHLPLVHKFKCPSSPATIVTAFFKIKSKHSITEYNEWMENILSMIDPMVIYTSPDMVAFVSKLRGHLSDFTVVVPMDLLQMKMPAEYGIEFWEKQHDMDPERFIHKRYYLYWIWNGKLEFLRQKIEENPFQSDFFAWVDCGYFRTTEFNHQVLLQRIPTELKEDQILVLDVSPITDTSDLMGGGFIGGYASGLLRFHSLFYSLLDANKPNFIGNDQDWYLQGRA